MNLMQGNAKEILNELYDENNRLKRLVNVLTEFKQFCDSIVPQLDYHLSPNQTRKYKELTIKFNKCNDTEDDEEIEDNDVKDVNDVTDADALSTTSFLHLFRSQLKPNVHQSNTYVQGGQGRPKSKMFPSSSSSMVKPTKPSNMLRTKTSLTPRNVIEVIALDEDDEEEEEEEEDNEQQSDDISERYSDLSKPYKCDYNGCDQKFKSKHRLDRHKLSHSTERPFSCPIGRCMSRYKRHDHLTTHMKQRHPNEFQNMKDNDKFSRPLSCPKCNLRFKYTKSLESHICSQSQLNNSQTQPESDYIVAADQDWELFDSENPCDVCPDVFGTRSALITHKMQVHRIFEINSIRVPQPSQPSTHSYNGVVGVNPPKKKLSSYWLYAKEMRPIVLEELRIKMDKFGMTPTMPEVNKEVGKRWHTLTEEQKNKYKEMCNAAKEQEDVVSTPATVVHSNSFKKDLCIDL